eukprot:CAMPEP_0113504634 /NCGR_PEP_ID=MMETSP0014_2-20120614/34827_1 /TAXON_ID=2857 /ORGANISM="Nitzschia sp." /LENGTH=465 /DNA_ID=CAMNT_0000399771 /DNA_START=139 /DNA_END=1533 /DNA_ORIENTATION=+ /assembly_acc=CAM_ASM_000159
MTILLFVVAIVVLKMERSQTKIRLGVVVVVDENFSSSSSSQIQKDSSRNSSSSRSSSNNNINERGQQKDDHTTTTTTTTNSSSTASETRRTDGVFVVGVGRSGTSLLTGLLASSSSSSAQQGGSYSTLGPLKEASQFNSKGYFGLKTFTRQNMKWLKVQGHIRDHNDFTDRRVQNFHTTTSNNTVNFELSEDGWTTLRLTQNVSNVPWVLKDPRLCFTLPIWLSIMDRELKNNTTTNQQQEEGEDNAPAPPPPIPAPAAAAAAVVFTFRHPLEVAQSMNRRNPRKQSIRKGLHTWLEMNKLAIKNIHSTQVCFVVTNMDDLLQEPLKEIQRITNELTSRCNVVPPPKTTTRDGNNLTLSSRAVVKEFVDPTLQHNSFFQRQQEQENNDVTLTTTKNDDSHQFSSTTAAVRRQDEHDLLILPPLVVKGGGSDNNNNNKTEELLLRAASTIFCDMKSGKAFQENYEW